MFAIPGWLVALLTFPGIMVHELAHLACCRVFGVPVHKVCLFRLGNPAGYVIHEKPRSVYQSLVIAVGPFLFNTILAAIVAAPGAPSVLRLRAQPVQYLLVWLGIAIGMHAFPSTGDAKAMWSAMWSEGSPFFAKIVGTPLVILIYVGALGSVVWLDAIYGVAVAMLLPRLLIKLLA
jgi:hypothetical protein